MSVVPIRTTTPPNIYDSREFKATIVPLLPPPMPWAPLIWSTIWRSALISFFCYLDYQLYRGILHLLKKFF